MFVGNERLQSVSALFRNSVVLQHQESRDRTEHVEFLSSPKLKPSLKLSNVQSDLQNKAR